MLDQYKGRELEKPQDTERAELLSVLRDGKVAFYGYQDELIPDILLGQRRSQVRIFQKKSPARPVGVIPIKTYEKRMEISETEADVCFLDREALMSLFVGFPIQPGCVLGRFALRWSWVFALPGIIRRVLKRRVNLCGILSLEMGGTKQRWVVIRRVQCSLYRAPSLSLGVGVPGFFEYLRQERIQYVVLRFYQSLPNLYREWGDLDILVADEDEQRIRGFLAENPGPIRIDVWNTSSNVAGQMAYYPPPLAKRILSSAQDGPASSRIPAPREAFLSFAYHALYHKGQKSGIPSKYAGVRTNPQPDNDYKGLLATMAEELEVTVDITMEDLDEYLHQQGWRPKLDSLAKIASENEWVARHFFPRSASKEKGLGVLILRKKAFTQQIVNILLKTVKEEGFLILRRKRFSEQETRNAAEMLRGGNWSGVGERNEELLPAMAVVVLDAHAGFAGQEPRIENLKEILRQRFDCGGASVVHSTDTTPEAWEYIEVCFTNEVAALDEEIRHLKQTVRLTFKDRLAFYPKALRYKIRKIINSFKNAPNSLVGFAVRRFLH